jgi:flagellar hook-associated protein 2
MVDVETESLDDIINKINLASGTTGVNASYDQSRDSLILENTASGDTSIITTGNSDDTSNFLVAAGIYDSYQDTSSGTTQVMSANHLGAISNEDILADANLGEVLTSGTFKINGTEISVDTATETLKEIIEKINNSEANVNATFDSSNDRLIITNNSMGDTLVNFTAGTSNFLDVVNLETSTAGTAKSSSYPLATDLINLANTTTKSIAPTVATEIDINGTSILIDEANSIQQAVLDINASGAGVTASYDETTGICKYFVGTHPR